VRSDFFVMMVLADAHLAAGEVEQACRVAVSALTAGEQIRLARCIGYLREFRRHLAASARVVRQQTLKNKRPTPACGVLPPDQHEKP
jgi:hypothetical protein